MKGIFIPVSIIDPLTHRRVAQKYVLRGDEKSLISTNFIFLLNINIYRSFDIDRSEVK